MKFIELIKKRRSVRKYKSQKIDRQIIDQCIEAARLAPSAHNSQPWSFIVVDDEEMIRQLVKRSMSGIYSSNSFVTNAAALIIVITEKADYITRLGGMIKGQKFSLIDIGIACDHLTLQAEELGIGSCWLGWFNERTVKKTLGLPKSASINILISLGYPQKEYIKNKQRKSLSDIRNYFSKE